MPSRRSALNDAEGAGDFRRRSAISVTGGVIMLLFGYVVVDDY
jgi:hypothetical protein